MVQSGPYTYPCFSTNISLIPNFFHYFSSFSFSLGCSLPFTPSPPFLLSKAPKLLVPSCPLNIYLISKLVFYFLNHIKAKIPFLEPYQVAAKEEKRGAQMSFCDFKRVLELVATRFETSPSLEVK